MTVDEYIERNPSVANRDYNIVKGIFEDLAAVVWVSRIDRQKNRSIIPPHSLFGINENFLTYI